jgi:hypothetical protein
VAESPQPTPQLPENDVLVVFQSVFAAPGINRVTETVSPGPIMPVLQKFSGQSAVQLWFPQPWS